MAQPTTTKLAEHLAQYRYNTTDRYVRQRFSTPLRAISPPQTDEAVAVTLHQSPASSKRKRQGELPPSESSSSRPSRSVTPKAKKNRAYATPETYAHLKAVPDSLKPGLNVVFCGINPSITSSKKQAPYSHPSNRFWKALHGGGFTDRLYDPQECIYLPERFNIGMTNLVSRPTAEQAELFTREMRRGSLELVQKILQYQPKVVCFVGKKIWDEFEFVIKKSARPAKNAWTDLTFSSESEQPPPTPELAVESNSTNAHPKERPKSSRPPFQWDQPRPYRVVHSPVQGGCGNTLFWVVPSTSGLVRVQLPEQIEHFAALGRMIEAIQHDQIPYDIFKEIDPDGVAATVALIPE